MTTPKKKILMVSTYKTACGIASFCETVESLVNDDFIVDVYPLDQFILRSEEDHLIKQGNNIIKDIVSRAKNYDVVNLQWEPSFLGKSNALIEKRLKKLLAGCPNLVTTVHTIFNKKRFSPKEFTKRFININIYAGMKDALTYYRDIHYTAKIFNLFKKHNTRYKSHFIVHTKREHKILTLIHGFKNVNHHPLSCIRKNWDKEIPAATPAFRKNLEDEYGSDTVFVGFFGFLTGHKGLDVLIESMRYTPENFKLLVFGGIHPNSIEKDSPIDGYIDKLHSFIGGKKKFNINKPLKDVFYSGSLANKVIFKGSPDDFEFAVAINSCDMNVFPYMEVGQSASAPVATSVELKKKTIVTNNNTFIELKKYFPDSLDMFDIGNYIQLSQIIKLKNQGTKITNLPYDNKTMKAFYSNIFIQLSSK